MSEVKRYALYASHVSGGTTLVEFTQDLRNSFPDVKGYVHEADFDRVTAELDAALGRVTELESSFDELAASVGFSEARLDQTGDSPIDCANQLQQRLTAADERAGELLIMLRMAWVDTEVSAENCRRIDAALKPAEVKCKTCNGTRIVSDGAMYCSSGGIPFECGPIECVKDCPDCSKP